MATRPYSSRCASIWGRFRSHDLDRRSQYPPARAAAPRSSWPIDPPRAALEVWHNLAAFRRPAPTARLSARFDSSRAAQMSTSSRSDSALLPRPRASFRLAIVVREQARESHGAPFVALGVPALGAQALRSVSTSSWSWARARSRPPMTPSLTRRVNSGSPAAASSRKPRAWSATRASTAASTQGTVPV